MAIEPSSEPRRPAKLSLARLSTAFSQLMSGKGASPPPSPNQGISPLQIVEALLFVGKTGSDSLSAAELAGPIRDLGPEEIPALVEQLNRIYREQAAAYEIVQGGGGYRMQLSSELSVVAGRVAGVSGEQKLSPAALEVLSIVAYRPGVSTTEVNRLRGRQSHAILARLVRWQLLEAAASSEGVRAACYRTTDRFQRAAGIQSTADLPQIETLDDAPTVAAP